jgi:hypothetical protein
MFGVKQFVEEQKNISRMKESKMRNYKTGLVAAIIAITFAFVAIGAQPVTASAAYGKSGISASTHHKKNVKKAKKHKKSKKSKKSKKAKKAKKSSGVFS